MRPLKLGSKINIVILLTCMLLTLLYGVILWLFEAHRHANAVNKVKFLMQATINQKHEDLANEIAYKLTDALEITFNDMLEIEGMLSIGAYTPSGELIHASKDCGRTFVRASLGESFPNTPTFLENRTHEGVPVLTYVTPIRVVGETVGFATVCYTLQEIVRETHFALALFSGLLLVILIVVSLVLRAMLSRFVTNPVLMLSSAMKRVQEGEMGKQVELDSEDEIGSMAMVFNEMSTKLRFTLDELKGSNERLEKENRERVRAEQRLSKINECFLRFGPDPKENISRLTALCGALQGATYAVYNRFSEGKFDALGLWHSRPEFSVAEVSEHYICRDVIDLGGDEVYLVRHLQQSPYARSHTGALPPDFHTYLGKAVKCADNYVGSLCVLFEEDVDPGEEDKKFMTIVAAAIGVEEERLWAEDEKRKLEAQILQTQKLESLGVLAGGIAHDFNNLLMGILGNAEMALMDLPETSAVAPLIRAIEKAGTRAAELTNQMLAYSGKGKFFVQWLNLNELIKEMADLLQVSISKKITIRYDFAEELPLIEADATQIRQIVMNLITNASEAIGDRTGLISLSTGEVVQGNGSPAEASLEEALAPGCHAYLEVSDTGCGMDEETRSRIFDPFFTTKFTGRGLGLAAVVGIVRSHKGLIQVRSQPGQGSIFKVLFPAMDCSSHQAAESITAPQRYSGGGTILVVDDEDMVRDVARMMLEELGFGVITARDGKEGVEIFRRMSGEIDAVLLDMTMPEMSGEEAITEMHGLRPEVRVILMSGYDEMEAANHFSLTKPAAFMQKPFQVATLAEKLRTVLGSDD
jgi:signal transduction histidine kinase/CheY-like chemotaxis protein/HAMP domain-containing protein